MRFTIIVHSLISTNRPSTFILASLDLVSTATITCQGVAITGIFIAMWSAKYVDTPQYVALFYAILHIYVSYLAQSRLNVSTKRCNQISMHKSEDEKNSYILNYSLFLH